jgi:hypothetical protein
MIGPKQDAEWITVRKRIAYDRCSHAASILRGSLVLRAGIDMTVKRLTSIAEYGILLLAPAILALAVIILLGLLGIFVVWLIVFWTLAAEIVASDLVRRYLLPATGGFSHGAIPARQ